jgi:hypothetical protein
MALTGVSREMRKALGKSVVCSNAARIDLGAGRCPLEEQDMRAMIRAGAFALIVGTAVAPPVQAGDTQGNFMVRVLGTVVDPDTDATVNAGGVGIAGANAEVSTQAIPALTLSHTAVPLRRPRPDQAVRRCRRAVHPLL